MAKKFSELRARMSPEAQARAAARAQAMLVEMQIQERRKARKVTQVEVAKTMRVEQAVEHAAFIEAHNAFVQKNGLPLEEYRMF